MEVKQKPSNALPLAYAPHQGLAAAVLPIHTPAKPSRMISSARHAGCHVMVGGIVCQLLLAAWPDQPTRGQVHSRKGKRQGSKPSNSLYIKPSALPFPSLPCILIPPFLPIFLPRRSKGTNTTSCFKSLRHGHINTNKKKTYNICTHWNIPAVMMQMLLRLSK